MVNCGYPDWVIERGKTEVISPTEKSKDHSDTERKVNKGLVVLPYIQGLTETLARVYKSYGIQTCIKPTTTLRQELVSPKDKVLKQDVIGAIYMILCEDNYCSDFYIGETERRLKTRFQEHTRPSSVPTSDVAEHIHLEAPGHQVNIESVKVLDKDHRYFERGVKESIYIRAHQPTLNRHPGRHQLSPVYNNILSTHVRKLTK